jgi:hypothetical protein
VRWGLRQVVRRKKPVKSDISFVLTRKYEVPDQASLDATEFRKTPKKKISAWSLNSILKFFVVREKNCLLFRQLNSKKVRAKRKFASW